MAHFVLIVVCAAAIYVACESFVNAAEWLGQRLKVGPPAIGTVLAAIGTALPESVVTFVAVVFGAAGLARDIGVGAAMGGPLVLATIAYGVMRDTIRSAAMPRRRSCSVDSTSMTSDRTCVTCPGAASASVLKP